MIGTIEFLAVLSFAVYGLLRGVRAGYDAVGIFAVAFIVTFGGGTLRDLFLDHRPLFWVEKDYYVMVVLGLVLAGAAAPRLIGRVERFLPVPDALGLGLFSIVGADMAVEAGTSMFIASIIGLVTGTFGGVMGDVVCNQKPSVFRPSELYVTCSFVGCWVYLLLGRAGAPQEVSLPVGIGVIVAMRLAALRWNIRIPTRAM